MKFVMYVITLSAMVLLACLFYLFWMWTVIGLAIVLTVVILRVRGGVARYPSAPTLKRVAWFAVLVGIVAATWLYGGGMLDYVEEKFSSPQSSLMDKRPAAPRLPPGAWVETRVVGREWSELILVPAGYQASWDVTGGPAYYQLKTQTGKIYQFSGKPEDKNFQIHGKVESVRFRVVDKEKETATFHLQFRPIGS